MPLGTEESPPTEDLPAETPTVEPLEGTLLEKYVLGPPRSETQNQALTVGLQGLELPVDDPVRAAQLLRRRGVSVKWLRVLKPRRAGTPLIEKAVAGPPPNSCLLTVTTLAGEPIELASPPRGVALEVAGSRLSRELGHPCPRRP